MRSPRAPTTRAKLVQLFFTDGFNELRFLLDANESVYCWCLYTHYKGERILGGVTIPTKSNTMI